MKQNLVSVMIPVYNQEVYIEECLNSILRQTYQELELIISDDCSTDSTVKIINKWIEEHKARFVRCEIIKNQTNQGIAKNFNVALRHSEGNYLKFLASDDVLMPEGIQVEVDYLERHPSASAVYANAWIIRAEDWYPINYDNHKLFFSKPPVYKNGLAEALFKQDIIPAPTVMLRKKTFERFGEYREDLRFEDWEYWLRLATGGAEIEYLDFPVVCYRQLEVSGSHFGKSDEEEIRYQAVISDEEKLLNDYKEKVKDNSMDAYWNQVLNFCIENDYKNTINKVLNEHHIHFEQSTRIKLVAYKMHLYKAMIRLYRKIFRNNLKEAVNGIVSIG